MILRLAGGAGAGAAGACVNVKVRPPIVRLPLRDAVVLFAATSKATVPLPEPVAPAVMRTHATLLVAVQAHPIELVTATVPFPAVAGRAWLVGVTA